MLDEYPYDVEETTLAHIIKRRISSGIQRDHLLMIPNNRITQIIDTFSIPQEDL